MRELAMATDDRELQRSLGVGALTLYGLGAILGAGIYSVIGAAAGLAGDAMWLAFLLSAVIVLVTALAYAELATTIPRAGAEYFYVREAMPRRRALAFAAGAMMVVSTSAMTSTVCVAFAGYLAGLVDVPRVIATPGLLVVVTAIALAGIRESAGMAIAFTLIEASGLVLVIGVAIVDADFGRALAAAPTPAILPATALVFFSYLGFEGIANLAEEAKRPDRDLARALLASVAIATVLYVLVALAAVALMPPAALAASDAPLADATAVHAPRIARVLGAIALFATANTALAGIVTGSRMIYGMAKAGALPAAAARVLPRRRTPWVATLVVVALAGALLPLGRVDVVASVSSFGSLTAFAAVNLALLVLRRRAPDRPRPFRVPFAIGNTPVLAIVGIAASAVLITQLDRRTAAADGERTPMLGGAVVWEPSSDEPAGMVGLELEAAWWYGRLGLAGEASGRSWVEREGPRALTVGASLRLRVFESLVPSLLESSDVELALELQGIVERVWWDRAIVDADPTRHGVGLALRLRGSSDDHASRLIAESRFFLRVLSARPATGEVLARTTTPPAEPRELIVLFGIGAAFGVGDPGYLTRFRRRPIDWLASP